MTALVEKAMKGSSSALKALYEQNNSSAYVLALLLTDDASRASALSAKAFTEAFDSLKNGSFSDEKQFREFVLEKVAVLSKGSVFKDSSKEFKLSSAKKEDVNKTAFLGAAEGGIEYLRKALKQMDRYQRFVSVLSVSGAFSEKKISQIVGADEAKVSGLVAASLKSLKEALENGGPVWIRNDAVKIENVYSLMEKAFEDFEVPASLDKATSELVVGKNAINMKALIPALISVAVAAAIIIGVCLSMFNKVTSKKYIADIVVENYGTITLELDGTVAPITVENFVEIARSGFYNGLTFHRIMDGFMIQGGSPDGTSAGESNHKAIKGEFSSNGVDNPISHVRGTISMARTNIKNSATTQFFICHQDSTFLDGEYAAFGKVISGIEVVDAICKDAKPIDDNGTIPASEQPKITSVTIRD